MHTMWVLPLQSQDREGDAILLFLERPQGGTCRWLGSQKSITGLFYHWETGLRVQNWGRGPSQPVDLLSLGSSCHSMGLPWAFLSCMQPLRPFPDSVSSLGHLVSREDRAAACSLASPPSIGVSLTHTRQSFCVTLAVLKLTL